jgi:hypothetical protein
LLLALGKSGVIDMSKRPTAATSADFNFITAYFELKKLREDIECIERASRPPQDQPTVSRRDTPKGDDRIQDVLRP